jgi:hypothetical protein
VGANTIRSLLLATVAHIGIRNIKSTSHLSRLSTLLNLGLTFRNTDRHIILHNRRFSRLIIPVTKSLYRHNGIVNCKIKLPEDLSQVTISSHITSQPQEERLTCTNTLFSSTIATDFPKHPYLPDPNTSSTLLSMVANSPGPI